MFKEGDLLIEKDRDPKYAIRYGITDVELKEYNGTYISEGEVYTNIKMDIRHVNQCYRKIPVELANNRVKQLKQLLNV